MAKKDAKELLEVRKIKSTARTSDPVVSDKSRYVCFLSFSISNSNFIITEFNYKPWLLAASKAILGELLL